MNGKNEFVNDARAYFDEFERHAMNDELWGFGIPEASIDRLAAPIRVTVELPEKRSDMRARLTAMLGEVAHE